LVTRQPIAHAHTGRGIAPTIWQKLPQVRMSDIRSNTGPVCR
jgi:hypothetical protein